MEEKMKPTKWRKKPVVIEAIELTPDNAYELAEWCSGKLTGHFGPDLKPYLPIIRINTLEGEMQARRGDYIVRGLQGEFYPVKPDIFLESYEQA